MIYYLLQVNKEAYHEKTMLKWTVKENLDSSL